MNKIMYIESYNIYLSLLRNYRTKYKVSTRYKIAYMHNLTFGEEGSHYESLRWKINREESLKNYELIFSIRHE